MTNTAEKQSTHHPAGTAAAKSYDGVPYESHSYPLTNPSHLCMVASLFGLTAPPPESARVLELGCALGGNLLPLALDCPKARFTGIDISQDQIDEANRHKEALGLGNVTFLQKDIMEIGPDFGTFDYIVAHGVLSWVPPVVQEKVLDICRDNLAKDGLAVVSYNALPGWNAVRSLREMMQYHCRIFQTPQDKVKQARLFLDFLSSNIVAGQEPFKAIIDAERGLLANANDSYLFHDHLEDENHQFYFHEFAEKIKARGLDYVGDTVIPTMSVGNLGAEAKEKLQAVGDRIRREQYIDFLQNRRFHSSIITHAEKPVAPQFTPDDIFKYYIQSQMKPEKENPDTNEPVTFIPINGQPGAAFTTNNKNGSELFLELCRRAPHRVKMKDVIIAVQKKLGLKRPQALETAARNSGMMLAFSGFINLYMEEAPIVTTVSEKPRANTLARYQASLPKCPAVTNAHRAMARTDLFTNHLLRHLDGQHDREALIARMVDDAANDAFGIRLHEQPVKDRAELRKIIEPLVDQALGKLAARCLLVG